MSFMSARVNRYKADESGAVTADYVVLAGAIIALGLSAVNAIRLGTFEGASDISDRINSSGCVTTGSSGTTDLSACN